MDLSDFPYELRAWSSLWQAAYLLQRCYHFSHSQNLSSWFTSKICPPCFPLQSQENLGCCIYSSVVMSVPDGLWGPVARRDRQARKASLGSAMSLSHQPPSLSWLLLNSYTWLRPLSWNLGVCGYAYLSPPNVPQGLHLNFSPSLISRSALMFFTSGADTTIHLGLKLRT